MDGQQYRLESRPIQKHIQIAPIELRTLAARARPAQVINPASVPPFVPRPFHARRRLFVLRSALNPAIGMFSEAKISVDNGGKVTWRPKFDANTNCDVDLTSWPWDRHKCTVTLSTWSHTLSNVFYEIKGDDQPVSVASPSTHAFHRSTFQECFQTAHSDWKLDGMASTYVEDNTPWDDIAASLVNEGGNNAKRRPPKQVSLQLVMEISRNTKMFETLFYSPLIRTFFHYREYYK